MRGSSEMWNSQLSYLPCCRGVSGIHQQRQLRLLWLKWPLHCWPANGEENKKAASAGSPLMMSPFFKEQHLLNVIYGWQSGHVCCSPTYLCHYLCYYLLAPDLIGYDGNRKLRKTRLFTPLLTWCVFWHSHTPTGVRQCNMLTVV